jgi:hypothetical protein
MNSVLVEQSLESAIRHSPGSDFESEEMRYAGRERQGEPEELPTEPPESLGGSPPPPDPSDGAEKVRSFAEISGEEASREEGRVDVATGHQAMAPPIVADKTDAPVHRVLDNTVPFHPEDPLRETN